MMSVSGKLVFRILCLFLIVLSFNGIFALEVEIPDDLKDDRELPREERIRRHQQRVQLILDARKKSREEEQARQASDAQERERAEEEQRRRASPPTEARERPRREGQPRSPGAPPPSSEGFSFSPASNKTLAQTILHFYPFDATVKVGDNLLTDMILFNAENRAMDSLKVTITYSPNLIKPIYVNDHALSDKLASPALYKIDSQKGKIIYECRFSSPQTLEGQDLLRIVWQALNPTDLTEISFDLSDDATYLSSGGDDILGHPYENNDGVIPTGITILSDMKSRDDFLILDKEIMFQAGLIPPEETHGDMFLNFETERKTLRAGEVFDVSILLSNPHGEASDKLSLLIRFDPSVFRVLDWDKRNRISVGINIQDGFARKSHPFDFHIRNDASNFTGRIDYRMGNSKPKILPSGEIARIRFQALAPSERSDIFFAHRKNFRGPNTSISLMGRELISPGQWLEASYYQLSLQVITP